MAIGRPGADSSNLVTRLIDGKPMVDVAADLFGEMPVVWGRYFTSAATSGLVEYRARRENQVLRDRNIRVLPIARQTKHVDGTGAQASVDAQLNVEDFIKTFGASYLQSQGGRFLMFLDVEGTPSLSIITTWDGLGRLLIIAKAFHMAWSRSFRGYTPPERTMRLGERSWRQVSEGCKPKAPGLPVGVYAAVVDLWTGTPLSLCLS